jgi:hypothetical protein
LVTTKDEPVEFLAARPLQRVAYDIDIIDPQRQQRLAELCRRRFDGFDLPCVAGRWVEQYADALRRSRASIAAVACANVFLIQSAGH